MIRVKLRASSRFPHRKFARPEFLLISFLLCGCDPGDIQPVLGSAFQVQGAATISRSRGTQDMKPRSFSTTEKFSAGDTIHLEKESSAVLCLTPGIYVRCPGETQLGIDELTISKDGDDTGNAMHERRAAVHCDNGRLHVFLPIAGASAAQLRIQSRSGTFTAKAGALFSVALADNSVQVVCLRGEVYWNEGPAFSATIPAGHFWRRTGDSLEGPKLAAEDATAQQEVMAVLESVQIMADLEDAARKAPAPWRN